MTVKRILVVEDEFLLALEMCTILTEAGYEVLGPVATVAKALDLIAGRKPHAAFVDCNLKGEPATAVALTLMALNVPFAVVTGYERERLPAAFSEAVFASKPCNATRLLEIAQKLLNEDRARQALSAVRPAL